MKTTLMALTLLALLGCQQTDNRVIVIGDSLSGQVDAWAFFMHEQDWAMVQNMAQPGQRLSNTLSAPDWLQCGFNGSPNTKVVVWLGTNDAYQGEPLVHDAMVSLLTSLEALGCSDIHVVLPPAYPWEWQENALTARTEVSGAVQGFPAVNLVDPEADLGFDATLTTDGIHPTLQHHKTLAVNMTTVLGIGGE